MEPSEALEQLEQSDLFERLERSARLNVLNGIYLRK
jgi:hypothetical protein